MEKITSRSNGLLVHMKKLAASAAYRREQGVYLCDSPKLLAEALKWHAPVREIAVTAGVPLPPLPETVRAVEIPEDVMSSISPMKSPQGALFTVTLPETAVPEALPGSRYMVLDGVQDPGNVGTLWRTADAFGADGMILLPGCADPWSPKTLRATMGACFRLPVWEGALDDLTPKLAQAGLPLYATALREDTVDLREMALRRCAVAIGSEGRGVSQAVLDASAKTVKIPMAEQCESLNAAIAGAVVLWQMGFGR